MHGGLLKSIAYNRFKFDDEGLTLSADEPTDYEQ